MPGSSRKQASGEGIPETRQLLVQVAQRLFMEQGYRAVSTRQIAAVCGITQPALYRHFATKQDLYVAVLCEMLGLLHGRLQHVVERRDSIPVRLQLIAQMLPATWIDARQMFHDIEHELDVPHQQVMAETFRRQIIQPIASLFQEGIAQGVLRDPAHGGLEAYEATFVLLRLLDDHGTPGAQARSRAQHAERMVHLLLHGLIQRSEVSE